MRSAALGRWEPHIQAHVESCPICRDIIRFSQLLQQISVEPRVPPANYVWWRSRMLQKRAIEKRVIRLIAITRTAIPTLSVIGLVGWAMRHWSELDREIKSAMDYLSARSSSALTSSALPLVYLSFVLLLINLVLTVRAMVIDGKRK